MTHSKTASQIFGVAFIAAGILGFIPNPIVSPDGIFAVDTMHNLLHILVGVGFLAGAAMGAPLRTIQVLAAAGVVLAILGFLTTGDMLLGIVHINHADRWLHAGLAAAIVALWAGLSRLERQAA